MTAREAASYLTERNYQCGIDTVRELAKAGRIKCYRPGVTQRGRMSFDPRWLDAFLRREEMGSDAAPAPVHATAPRRPTPRPAPVAAKVDDWKSDYDRIVRDYRGKKSP